MDRVSKAKRSYIMSQIKSNSSIEVIPRELVGLYLRKHQKNVFGNPDFSNKSKKIALFIDGCFWHGCKVHFKMPKTNRKFWKNKISRNMKRDKQVNRTLRKEGWTIIRVWEHKSKKDLKNGQK